MNRFASTRSFELPRQPDWPVQWKVGSIDDDGIRYGLTMKPLTRRTTPTAIRIVIAQSAGVRQRGGRRCVSRAIGPFFTCRLVEHRVRLAAGTAGRARSATGLGWNRDAVGLVKASRAYASDA